MIDKSFRNKVVTGPLTLPIMVVIASILWFVVDPITIWSVGGLASTLFMAYLLMELNNRNQLLRIRSRMVSCSFLALSVACTFTHQLSWQMIPAYCLVVSYLLLFSSYQKLRPEGIIFHTFFFLGIGSLAFPPMLLLPILFYIEMVVQLRSLTWRTFLAGIFGLIIPYWFLAGWAVWKNQLDSAFLYLLPYFEYQIPDYKSIPLWQYVNFGFLLVLVLLGLIHYYRTNFNDKIRVRMCFYIFIIQELAIIGGMVAYPCFFNYLFPLLIVNSSPLIAHYFTLAKGRVLMNIWFIFWLVITIALYCYNSGLLPLENWLKDLFPL